MYEGSVIGSPFGVQVVPPSALLYILSVLSDTAIVLPSAERTTVGVVVVSDIVATRDQYAGPYVERAAFVVCAVVLVGSYL